MLCEQKASARAQLCRGEYYSLGPRKYHQPHFYMRCIVHGLLRVHYECISCFILSRLIENYTMQPGDDVKIVVSGATRVFFPFLPLPKGRTKQSMKSRMKGEPKPSSSSTNSINSSKFIVAVLVLHEVVVVLASI